jgi:co-chaperonin GroES (HSP10)
MGSELNNQNHNQHNSAKEKTTSGMAIPRAAGSIPARGPIVALFAAAVG